MIISENYLLKDIMDSSVLIPVGQYVAEHRSILSLNETSAFICKQLVNELTEDELLERMYFEYETENQEERDIIKGDVEIFLKEARQKGVIVD